MPLKGKELAKKRQKEYSRKWYLKNRDRVIKQISVYRDRKRREWAEFKAKHSCTHCGFSHPAVMDFHHVIRTNKRSVNKLATINNNVTEAIKEATEKCIPLCSNCHRILHWEEHAARRPKTKKLSRPKSKVR